MVQVKNLNYDSWETICFQRSTVIITELLLVYALHRSVFPCEPGFVLTRQLR
jgi:alpha-1,3-glucosyltransferase